MQLSEKVREIHQQVASFQASTAGQVEQFRVAYVGRKGAVAELFDELRNVPPEEKRAMGAELNNLKNFAQNKLTELQTLLASQPANGTHLAPVDLTLPVIPNELGTVHPLTIVRNRIIEIFERIGFNVSEGPQIEDDWHNFTALNFPPNHPARDMQDTFFVEQSPDVALRTHTSSVQVRLMEGSKPPFRSIMPGRVFRNEAISARAHCVFHQVEGLFVDTNVGFADLKQTLYYFAKEMFGKDIKIRFRPSYFPFTEPSAEMDISCLICKGEGCNICKHTGWVEILGSGMVDPNVFKNCGIDPEIYTGFAFGMGIERIANLRYQLRDLRLFTENDVRFLRQFGPVG